MSLTEKQLGQVRPSGTSATSIYSPATSSITGIVLCIKVCNTSTSSAKFSIYQDDDGSDYDETTALHFEQTLAAKSSVTFNDWLPMNDANGNLAVQTDTGDALTLTVWGTEKQ